MLRKISRVLAVASVAALAPASSYAYCFMGGTFASVHGDFSFANGSYNLELTDSGKNTTTSALHDFSVKSTLEHNSGYGVYGSIGYVVPGGLGFEVEVGYRHSKEVAKADPALNFVNYGILSGMLGVSYAIPSGLSIIQPYLAAAVGLARAELSGTYQLSATPDITPLVTPGTFSGAHKMTVAYDLAIGLGFTLSDGVAVNVAYKYFALASFSGVSDLASETKSVTDTVATESYEFQKNALRMSEVSFSAHTIDIGVSFLFII